MHTVTSFITLPAEHELGRELFTSSEWLHFYKRTHIVDPLGWDKSSKDAFQISFYRERITELEFLARLRNSRVLVKSKFVA